MADASMQSVAPVPVGEVKSVRLVKGEPTIIDKIDAKTKVRTTTKQPNLKISDSEGGPLVLLLEDVFCGSGVIERDWGDRLALSASVGINSTTQDQGRAFDRLVALELWNEHAYVIRRGDRIGRAAYGNKFESFFDDGFVGLFPGPRPQKYVDPTTGDLVEANDLFFPESVIATIPVATGMRQVDADACPLVAEDGSVLPRSMYDQLKKMRLRYACLRVTGIGAAKDGRPKINAQWGLFREGDSAVVNLFYSTAAPAPQKRKAGPGALAAAIPLKKQMRIEGPSAETD